jgi:MOSC domain-containing protein YiiM
MPKLVVDNGRTGWYLRVLDGGIVASGDALSLVDRPYPQWTIEAVNRVAYNHPIGAAAARALSACPLLADAWRSKFRKLLAT